MEGPPESPCSASGLLVTMLTLWIDSTEGTKVVWSAALGFVALTPSMRTLGPLVPVRLPRNSSTSKDCLCPRRVGRQGASCREPGSGLPSRFVWAGARFPETWVGSSECTSAVSVCSWAAAALCTSTVWETDPTCKFGIDAHYVICSDLNAVGHETVESLLGDSNLVIARRHSGNGVNAAVVAGTVRESLV